MAWIKKPRDTGFLDITSLIEPGAGYVDGRLMLRRDRGTVTTLIMDDLIVNVAGTQTLYRLPGGFRPFHTERAAWWQPSAASATAGGTLNISPGGYVVGYQLQPGLPMTARIQFDSVQPWPSTYPGIEVQL